MVLLHIKRGESSLFLYETSIRADISKLTFEIVTIYNGCLKVRRICAGLFIFGKFNSTYNKVFIAYCV